MYVNTAHRYPITTAKAWKHLLLKIILQLWLTTEPMSLMVLVTSFLAKMSWHPATRRRLEPLGELLLCIEGCCRRRVLNSGMAGV
jgi:hypothetical protein